MPTALASRSPPLSTTGDGGGDRLRRTAVGRVPVEVLEPRVDIPGGLGAVIHVKAVFIHIEREQRYAGRSAVHVIPSPMIVERARVDVVSEDCQARAARKAHAGAAEFRLPCRERAESGVNGVDRKSGAEGKSG